MDKLSIAVLGGDLREVVMAQLLQRDGHDVATYGLGARAASGFLCGDGLATPESLEAVSALAAVKGRAWLLCPSPGLEHGDTVYAPSAEEPICLDEDLLSAAELRRGGIVLGKATTPLTALMAALGGRIVETKGDETLKVRLSTSVAEGVVELIVNRTDRILREQRVLVLGYGGAGSALANLLVLMGAQVTVAARRPESRALAEQHGAASIPYDDRIGAMATATVIVNAAPDPDCLPLDAIAGLGEECLVIDIASPPGGLDHPGAAEAGIPVLWARGLAGGRAPRTAGELQYRFVLDAIHAGAPAPVRG